MSIRSLMTRYLDNVPHGMLLLFEPIHLVGVIRDFQASSQHSTGHDGSSIGLAKDVCESSFLRLWSTIVEGYSQSSIYDVFSEFLGLCAINSHNLRDV